MMRAKMRVTHVHQYKNGAGEVVQEDVSFSAVGPKEAYPADGSDENNTFAKWTPNGSAAFSIMNPALFGKYVGGTEFYVDFTPATPLA